MSDIHSLLHEIDEDLHKQKLEAFWQKYGLAILVAALAIILATASYTGWTTWHEHKNQKATEGLIRILMSEDTASAKRIEALQSFAQKKPETAQAVLSRFEAAHEALKAGKAEEAIKIYDALWQDQKVEADFRELANFYSVQAQMDHGDPAKLIARLEPYFADGAWKASEKEYAAHLALKSGDKDKAKDLFAQLSQSSTAPFTIKQRAREMTRWMEETH